MYIEHQRQLISLGNNLNTTEEEETKTETEVEPFIPKDDSSQNSYKQSLVKETKFKKNKNFLCSRSFLEVFFFSLF